MIGVFLLLLNVISDYKDIDELAAIDGLKTRFKAAVHERIRTANNLRIRTTSQHTLTPTGYRFPSSGETAVRKTH